MEHLARRCVFTVLTGFYEPLNEQPAARDSRLPFICFTDDPAVASETWEVRRFTPIFPGDAIRSARTIKILPFAQLPEFDQSLYIDNSVLLTSPPEDLFAAADLSPGLCLPLHSFHASLLDEFAAVARDQLDDPARIAGQLAEYMEHHAALLTAPLFWTGMMLRDHRHERMRAAMADWLARVYLYSRRDQLSAPLALHRNGLVPADLAIDNHESPFHRWPQLSGRRAAARLWERQDAATALRACEVEREICRQRLQRLEYEHVVLLQSTSWRALAPLRAVMRRLRGGSSRLGDEV
jgi:hypothetical protein